MNPKGWFTAIKAVYGVIACDVCHLPRKGNHGYCNNCNARMCINCEIKVINDNGFCIRCNHHQRTCKPRGS